MVPSSSVEFPNIPGNCPIRVNAPEDVDLYADGYTTPYLLRVYEQHNVEFADPSVEFNPYNQQPQFEFGPRKYKLYISGTNSYRLTDLQNHDEESEFWEIP